MIRVLYIVIAVLSAFSTFTPVGSVERNERRWLKEPSTKTSRCHRRSPKVNRLRAEAPSFVAPGAVGGLKGAWAMGLTSVYFHSSLPRRAVGKPSSLNLAMASFRKARAHPGSWLKPSFSKASRAAMYGDVAVAGLWVMGRASFSQGTGWLLSGAVQTFRSPRPQSPVPAPCPLI